MSENRNRDFSKYDSMSTDELEEILRLDVDAPEGEESDTELLLYVMKVLADRKRNNGGTGKTAQQAYESFKENYLPTEDAGKTKPNLRPLWGFLRVACVVVVVGLLFAFIPQRAEAETLWEKIARWTNDFFELITPGTNNAQQQEYVFETDNEGLREVYEAVLGMGVEEPQIPTWIPEEYDLTECSTLSTPDGQYVQAGFYDGNSQLILVISPRNTVVSNQYPKDETQITEFEADGTTYYIVRNNAKWVVVWSKDDLECFLVTDCQEDILKKIIESI